MRLTYFEGEAYNELRVNLRLIVGFAEALQMVLVFSTVDGEAAHRFCIVKKVPLVTYNFPVFV